MASGKRNDGNVIDKDDVVNDGRDRIRMLIKRFRIFFKGPGMEDEWPSHKDNFQNIQKIRTQNCDTYCAAINIHSSKEPWKDETKGRAKWLAKRALEIFGQQRNEAGWRFTLENHILKRFTVEVACPNCRARLWRSEIEVSMHESDKGGKQLEERQGKRTQCICPPQDRPRDYHDSGINRLFDDRAQETILHDPLVKSQLPNKEPDRVYGLKATNNITRLLSAQVAGAMMHDTPMTLDETIRSCPFKHGNNPLLFPFLILEAKSEKSKDGFDDILTQTAFPILALLKLQKDLYNQVPSNSRTEPLVWFFANRGDVWRVYGCCITDDDPAKYYIFQLWDGSIMYENNALQLLLIVDYVFDWARDVYRPSILRQLKSLTTGKAYDDVSLTADSGINSLVDNWIQPAPSTMGCLDTIQDPDLPTLRLDHESELPMRIPNTERGTMRSTHLVDSTVVGLYITEHNLPQLIGDNQDSATARKILNFFSRWDETLLVTGENLDDLEEIWTGKARDVEEAERSSRKEKFYTLIEFASFVNTSWNLVRELTYVAISTAAFSNVVSCAAYTMKHPGITSVPSRARSCEGKLLAEGLRCLRSGSPSQVFAAAVACTSISIYQLPIPRRTDYTPSTTALGFGPVKHPQLPGFVHKVSRLVLSARLRQKGKGLRPSTVQLRAALLATSKRLDELSENSTLIRRSEKRDRASDADVHEARSCERCHQSELEIGNGSCAHHKEDHSFSAYGVNVTVSLTWTKRDIGRHEICVFVDDAVSEMISDVALSVIVQDLSQTGSIYHTILHPANRDLSLHMEHILHEHDRLWNLPIPHRSATQVERKVLRLWLMELTRDPIPLSEVTPEKSPGHYWNALQILMHFLNLGDSCEAPHQEAAEQRFKHKDRSDLFYTIFPSDPLLESKSILQLAMLPLSARGD